MPRRRELNVFTWSFLDAITCGFGAVVLTFVIVSAQVADRAKDSKVDLRSETSRLEEEVLDARKNLVKLRNSLRDDQKDQAVLAEEAARLAVMLARLQAQEKAVGETVARKESVEQLRADIKQIEEANERLAARAAERSDKTGQQLRAVVGEGNRQYVTGLRVGGKRVVILLDASTSMLGRNYVNVVRFRSMPDAKKIMAPKWQQAVKTVDWLTAQIKPGTEVQILAFNEKVHSLMAVPANQWVNVQDGSELERAVAALRKLVPTGGTSLIVALEAAEALKPLPDNVFLITDGLPTVGKVAPIPPEDVRPFQRVAFFNKAVVELRPSVPVNVILFPMDGDPGASGLFWDFVIRHRGSMLTPTEDWP